MNSSFWQTGSVFASLFYCCASQSAPVNCRLEHVDFQSNIHQLRTNGENITQHGKKYPAIEWTPANPNATIMHAIKERMEGVVGFHIEGVDVGSKIVVTGVAKKYYAMDLSGELFIEQFAGAHGNVIVAVKSKKYLPESIRRLDDEISWIVDVTTPDGIKTRSFVKDTCKVTCYLVFSDNHSGLSRGAEPTPDRLEHAYARFQSSTGYLTLAYALPNMAHSLNRHVSRYYNPVHHYTNETCWNVPNSWGVRGGGASCISISRYCHHVLQILGFPGKVDVDAFWAKPDLPHIAIGGGTDAPDVFIGSRSGQLKLYLVDGRNSAGGGYGGFGGMNNYEGTLIYTDSRDGIYYYPGGTQYMYRNKNQVLGVFRSLAWTRYDNKARQWQVVQVIAAYQGGVGTVATNTSPPRLSSSKPRTEKPRGLLGRLFGRG